MRKLNLRPRDVSEAQVVPKGLGGPRSCECGEYQLYRSLRVGLAYCSSPGPDSKKKFNYYLTLENS